MVKLLVGDGLEHDPQIRSSGGAFALAQGCRFVVANVDDLNVQSFACYPLHYAIFITQLENVVALQNPMRGIEVVCYRACEYLDERFLRVDCPVILAAQKVYVLEADLDVVIVRKIRAADNNKFILGVFKNGKFQEGAFPYEFIDYFNGRKQNVLHLIAISKRYVRAIGRSRICA